MAAHHNVAFGQFGDMRDQRSGAGQKYSRQEMYQPEGSKERFHLEESYGNVKAHRIGKPDEILPGGRPAKQLAAHLDVWGGGSGNPEGHKEILNVGVRGGFQGKGLADAMLRMAVDRHPGLSHSGALSAEGARFAARNPLPGDTAHAKQSVRQNLTADAATTMLGGPKRRGYV
jgi:hypothetical protein